MPIYIEGDKDIVKIGYTSVMKYELCIDRKYDLFVVNKQQNSTTVYKYPYKEGKIENVSLPTDRFKIFEHYFTRKKITINLGNSERFEFEDIFNTILKIFIYIVYKEVSLTNPNNPIGIKAQNLTKEYDNKVVSLFHTLLTYQKLFIRFDFVFIAPITNSLSGNANKSSCFPD